MDLHRTTVPLLSVIIPTYNYAVYLPVAIESIQSQGYSNLEIIVIDDGSTDETRDVIGSFPDVKYFYQTNKGLSAARNFGIEKSTGEYLAFLDADDWFEQNAFTENLSMLLSNPALAFSSGNYILVEEAFKRSTPVYMTVKKNHYERLLESNYIGMHASVLFRRWAFDYYRYDENLKACEDYDLYLNLARQFPVTHQQQLVASYNFHKNGLSHNYPIMYHSFCQVLTKQKSFITNKNRRKAFQKGINESKKYYCLMRYNEYFQSKPFSLLRRIDDLICFLNHDKYSLKKIFVHDIKKILRLKTNLPESGNA